MCSEKILCSKEIKKKNGPKINFGSGNFFWKKLWAQRKILTWKKMFKKILGPKQFWVRKEFEFEHLFGSNKISGLKEVLSENILVHKNLDPQKSGSKKFGQNRTSNSWDIAYLDKCHQGICCLDKCHHNSWHLLNIVPRPYL